MDEAGIDLSNLKYFDAINKGFGQFFQTARHRNYIFIATVPYLSLVSKQVRTLMTCQLMAQGWTKKNRTIVAPRILEYNGDIDKFYRKRLLVRTPVGISFCNEIRLPKPPKRLITEYESLKKEFTGDLFADISSSIDAFEEKEKSKGKKNPLTARQKETLDLLREGMLPKGIAKQFDISLPSVHETLRAIRVKGYVIKGIRKSKLDNTVVSYSITDPESD